MAADVFQLFSQRLGIDLVLHPTQSWSETLRAAKNRQCDLIGTAKATEERRTYLDFTTPYLSFPYVVATRNDQFFIDNFADVLDKTYTAVRDYSLASELRQRYPQLRVREVENNLEGLQQVRDGKAFGYIDATAVVAAALRQNGLVGIRISGQLPIGFEVSIASRNDEPLLHSIMQKAVASLAPEEIKRIQDKWLAVTVQRVVDYTLMWRVLALGTLVLALLGYWNRTLHRAKGQTEQALKALEAAQLQLQQQNQRLEQLSITDRLTQIYNRVKLDSALQYEIQRAARYGYDFGVIMLDVDHFKQVNDTHGHQVGDQVLVDVAWVLRTHTRISDILGRWGGEEFLIICPEIDRDGIARLAEYLRGHIAQHPFPVIQSKTASFGAALYQPQDSAESLVGRADEALYRAKNSGRNRVEMG